MGVVTDADAATVGPIETTWSRELASASREEGDRHAFRFAGPDWSADLTFAAWGRLSDAVATSLAALGVGPGERVAVLAPGGPVWPVLQTACSRLGAVIVPVNTRYRSDELGHVLGVAAPVVAVVIERFHRTDYGALVSEVLAKVSAVTRLVLLDDSVQASLDPAGSGRTASAAAAGVAGAPLRWEAFLRLGAGTPVPTDVSEPGAAVLMQFTSGTSAFPKAALLSNRASYGATWHMGARMGITRDDVYFSTQPMYHVGGSVATTLLALGARCTMVVPERYSVEAVFDLVPRHGCTARTGQAAMYAMEMAHPDFSPELFASVVKAWSGGSADLKRSIRDVMGIDEVTTIYGLTETGGTTTITAQDDGDDVRWDSCGRPIPGVEVAVAHDGVIDTVPAVVGEVCIRGWSVMNGYFGDPTATAAAIDTDGWFHTGDLGSLDERGYLYFVDRLKDMIKPGGENVSAAEVERVIFGHPAVAEVAVVGRPDARLGEVPVAFVELRRGGDAAEAAIIAWCAARMASFKVPREIHFVQDWPMTESGKIQKRLLRERLAGQDGALIGRTG
ncbi:class I adenylate-forming enzyme family protein [Nakamurella endophytica]|uniref:AMP-binding protein n=1 Tax=Nakamurella endophytica TaxID=1748367 RepID=A0A917STJ5_9ACTN|nr:class I adenylate-forming enzyme family protein [Nakamurella endophytica]GGL94896.1 AMP-binding protein [Nakamurella endophytica]